MRMRVAFIPLCFLAVRAASSGSCWAVEVPGRAKIGSVADGDTVRIVVAGKSYRARLIGVDTPEAYPSAKLDRDAARTGRDKATIIALGKRASAFTRKVLPKGAAVRMEYDQANAARGHRDRYGRLLAYLWTVPAKGKPLLVNAEIIRQGYGNALTRYPYDRKRQELSLKLQREARENRRGLWGDDVEAKPGTTGVLVDSKRSNKYHRPECRWAQKISPKNRIVFKNAAEAKAAGYVPCKVCRPPE